MLRHESRKLAIGRLPRLQVTSLENSPKCESGAGSEPRVFPPLICDNCVVPGVTIVGLKVIHFVTSIRIKIHKLRLCDRCRSMEVEILVYCWID